MNLVLLLSLIYFFINVCIVGEEARIRKNQFGPLPDPGSRLIFIVWTLYFVATSGHKVLINHEAYVPPDFLLLLIDEILILQYVVSFLW